MRVFKNKSMFKKIVIALLIVIVAGFCFSGKVQADDGEIKGGSLLSPIADLFNALGDSAMDIVHKVIYKQDQSTIEIDMVRGIEQIAWLLAALVVVLAAFAVVGLIVTGVSAALAALLPSLFSVSIGTVLAFSTTSAVVAGVLFTSNAIPDNLQLPVYQVSPEEIFSNDILLFDVDFFNPKPDKVLKDQYGNNLKDENGNDIYTESTAKELRSIISNWYNILRDIAVVALLSILVYVGIRIVISSTANDKAKYKQLLMDWFVAICLLFIMQYIMSFANLAVSKITEVIKSTTLNKGYIAVMEDKDGIIEDSLEEYGYEITDDMKENRDGKDYINWGTNLMGMVRLQAQMQKDIKTTYIGYTLVFVVLVLYTLYFIFTYLRRVLYMAFLTLISPLVAMTYPIDKINDGKAQAFNIWFREYIFNLLIQPMHLILYTILVSSAFELASENILYSLVAIGFMIPAEKLLRKFFGFEKAQTPGFLGGAAGAGLTMAAMNKFLSKGGSGGGKDGGTSKSSSKDNSNNQKLYTDPKFNKEDGMLGDGGNYSQRRGSDNQNNVPPRDSNNLNDDIVDLPEDDENSDYNFDNAGMPLLEDKSMTDDVGDDNIDYDDSNKYTPPTADNDVGGLDDGIETIPPTSADDDSFADFDHTDPNIIDVSEDELRTVGGNNEDNSDTSDDEEMEKPTIKQRLKNGAKNFGKNFGRNFGRNFSSYYSPDARRYYARGLKEKMANKVKNARPLEAGLKFAGGAALGLTAGGLGLAAGIASGDISNVAKYGGGALLGGYKLGSGKASGMMQAFEVDGMEEIREREKYKTEKEYIEAKQKEYTDDFRRNKDNQYKLEKTYGKKRAKEIMDNVVPDCIKYGINNVEDVMTINEMMDKDIVKDVKTGASTVKYASMIGDTTNMKEKDKKEWRETVKADFAKNKRVRDNNMDTDKIADDVMRRVNSYYKIKDDIKTRI